MIESLESIRHGLSPIRNGSLVVGGGKIILNGKIEIQREDLPRFRNTRLMVIMEGEDDELLKLLRESVDNVHVIVETRR